MKKKRRIVYPKQLKEVRDFVLCRDWPRTKGWYQLLDISHALLIPEQSASARLRDLRKKRYGSFKVLSRIHSHNPRVFEYKVIRQRNRK